MHPRDVLRAFLTIFFCWCCITVCTSVFALTTVSLLRAYATARIIPLVVLSPSIRNAPSLSRPMRMFIFAIRYYLSRYVFAPHHTSTMHNCLVFYPLMCLHIIGVFLSRTYYVCDSVKNNATGALFSPVALCVSSGSTRLQSLLQSACMTCQHALRGQ